MRQFKNTEVEIRFRILDIKEFRQKLKNSGFKCVQYWQGSDIIFDKDGLVGAGRLLRLRLRRHWDKKAKLTYKGPYQNPSLPGEFKVREEMEIWVDNPQMTIKILETLGYQPVIQYEKRTALWKNSKGVEVVVEKLPCLGYFAEIEGAERNIQKVAKILGYDIKEGIKKSYREYFSEIDRNKKNWFFK